MELHVRRTADDALVVHHDAVLADAGPIVAMTLAELKEVAPHVAYAGRGHEGVPRAHRQC